MINTQAPWLRFHNKEGLLDVFDVFPTIQGEGPFSGFAAIFVRLAGCNLQCPGCDTDYTSQHTRMTPTELIERVKELDTKGCHMIVITGGEPFRQNVAPFVQIALDEHYMIQIETNGLLDPGQEFPWLNRSLHVVCSPKTGKIHRTVADMADAYKYVVSDGNVAVEDGLPLQALGHELGSYDRVARPPRNWVGPVYVQPEDSKDEEKNELNRQTAVRTVLAGSDAPGQVLVLSIQDHKIVGLP